jgi:hypothetical protein
VQFQEASGRFDTAYLTEGLADLITAKIASPLLRREAVIAADVVVRHLNKPNNDELAERSRKAAERLVATVDRLGERSSDGFALAQANALCDLLGGRFGEAASAAEEFVKPQAILRVFVGALRMERFDGDVAVKMLAKGHPPAAAVHSGLMIGSHSWWPSWLLSIVRQRAMAAISTRRPWWRWTDARTPTSARPRPVSHDGCSTVRKH